MAEIILEMKSITKEFPGVKALNQVQLQVTKGEIHALVGENGAGKSTLMNLLSGVYPHGSYTGEIIYQGEECKFKNIRDSEHVGIVIIHQELALVPYMTIAENLFLGNERANKGIIDWNATNGESVDLLRKVGLQDNPSVRIKDIGVGKQQLVEIAKALAKEVKLLILDEPTAALNEEESQNLLKLLLELKKQGVTSIIISHKLNEIEQIADSITILRDGATIETLVRGFDDFTEERIIKGMVGREIVDRFPGRDNFVGDVALEVNNWSVYDTMDSKRHVIKNVNFNVREGEIVGIAGLMGAGRTELAMSLFGGAFGSNISGDMILKGKKLRLKSEADAMKVGIAYLTEDRKSAGLVLIDDIRHNITMGNHKKISKNYIIDEHKEVNVANEYRNKLNIRSSSIRQRTGNLSGGNQQKVVLSRWIYSDPEVLFLDEPTRGIDVGAKFEIYQIMNELVSQGKSIVMISSEMPELLGMCDRVYVMNEGRIIGEFNRYDATQENIMRCIMRDAGKDKSYGQTR